MERLDAKKAIIIIQKLIKELLKVFLFCKSKIQELSKLRNDLETLDKDNPEYREILKNQRENTKMIMLLVVLILSFFVDFLLLQEALIILCDQFGWSAYIKFIIPIFLIILEVAISYFAILESRNEDEDNQSTIGRNLQYLLIPILVGFSLISLFYHLQSYNSEIDGASLLTYMSFNVIIQIGLLITSIMLHIWLIRNSEEIAEAISYFRYHSKRKKLSAEIDKLEKSNSEIHYPLFTTLAKKFVKKVDDFERRFPEMKMNFTKSMPQELIDGINQIMGRKVIAPQI